MSGVDVVRTALTEAAELFDAIEADARFGLANQAAVDQQAAEVCAAALRTAAAMAGVIGRDEDGDVIMQSWPPWGGGPSRFPRRFTDGDHRRAAEWLRGRGIACATSQAVRVAIVTLAGGMKHGQKK